MLASLYLLPSIVFLLPLLLWSLNEKCEISWPFYGSSSIIQGWNHPCLRAKIIFKGSIINDSFQMTNAK
jgi:hypothetical protein